MVWTTLSATPKLVPVSAIHGVMPDVLIFEAIFYFGAGLTSVVLVHFVTMGPTVACLGEADVWDLD